MTTKTKPPALVGGPYHKPEGVNIGVVARCEVRGDLLVTGFTDAPIPWPVGRPRDAKVSRPSLLVRDDLARAVETESVAALCHWFGVGATVANKWRRALGVGRVTPGTSALLADRPPPAPTVEEARARGSKGARKRWGEKVPE